MKLTRKKKLERNRIIKAAGSVFKKYGFRKTTMNDIASVSGKAKSSVYYYFKSKDEIYNAVIFAEGKQYRQKVLNAIKELKTPEEQLKAYIFIRLRTDKVYTNFYYAMNSYTGKNNFIKRLKIIYDKEEFRIFSNILNYGAEKGFFEIYDIKYAAVGIVTAMRGIESVLLHQRENTETEETVDNILQIILYGIIKR